MATLEYEALADLSSLLFVPTSLRLIVFPALNARTIGLYTFLKPPVNEQRQGI